MHPWLDRWLSSQAARPRGLFAPLVGRWLERENVGTNEDALAALALRAGETVLEVGCGPGWALARLAACSPARIAAVDVAPAMLRRARRRTAPLRALARAGRLDVSCAPAESLPFPAATFDAALAVNAVYFWRPPLAGLTELRRVLRPGGRAVLAMETPEALAAVGATPSSGFTLITPPELGELCRAAGFDAVAVRHFASAGQAGVYCVHATVQPIVG